ncbi:MAG TPA: class I SAM-dependent methyltransferase [Candidatus Angelobacter sp.]|nr:class I SAM-dependent methyltransferase [Candidatus Angelobacter sp.]
MAANFTTRFTGRASFYSTSRPDYPRRILDILRTEIGFDESYMTADIGSGTGLLSQLFLENGNRVLAVEPNDEMRRLAEKSLRKFPRFLSVGGTAEHTGLESASVDLVVVGQALHWFDREASSREFERILRTNGHVCIIYNDRNIKDSFMKDYDQIVRKYARNRASVPTIDDAYLSRFFKNGKYSKFSLPNEQLLDLERLLGRMTSASYMPSPSDGDQFALLRDDAARLFKTHEKLGKVRMLYDTTVLLGNILS